MEVWEGVVGGLADAPAAFAELEGLEEKRCRLLAMPEAKRKAAGLYAEGDILWLHAALLVDDDNASRAHARQRIERA